MKIKKIQFCIRLCALWCFFLASCASVPFSGNAVFMGKISSVDGKGVENFKVCLEGKETLTNASGVFSFEDVSSGEKQISAFKKGWAPINEKVVFSDRKNLLCFQIENMGVVYGKLEKLLTEGFYAEGRNLLEKNRSGNEKEKNFIFYESVLKYIENPCEENKKLCIYNAGLEEQL